MRAIAVAVGLFAIAVLAPLVFASPARIPPADHHHANHSWPIASTLPAKTRLVLLRRVASHDRWVIGTRSKHHRSTVALHRRQIRWTAQRIAKAKRQIREDGGGPIPGYWLALHDCEQPHGWHHGSPYVRFPGGLGIAEATWEQYRPPGSPGNIFYATPWQQINAARALMRFVTSHGYDIHGSWANQCGDVAARVMAIEGL